MANSVTVQNYYIVVNTAGHVPELLNVAQIGTRPVIDEIVESFVAASRLKHSTSVPQPREEERRWRPRKTAAGQGTNQLREKERTSREAAARKQSRKPQQPRKNSEREENCNSTPGRRSTRELAAAPYSICIGRAQERRPPHGRKVSQPRARVRSGPPDPTSVPKISIPEQAPGRYYRRL